MLSLVNSHSKKHSFIPSNDVVLSPLAFSASWTLKSISVHVIRHLPLHVLSSEHFGCWEKRNSQLEHACRAKERTLQKLQDKVRVSMEKVCNLS